MAGQHAPAVTIATEGGVDLPVPPPTPWDVLDTFVASCNIGQCDCATTFVSKIAGKFEQIPPGHARVGPVVGARAAFRWPSDLQACRGAVTPLSSAPIIK